MSYDSAGIFGWLRVRILRICPTLTQRENGCLNERNPTRKGCASNFAYYEAVLYLRIKVEERLDTMPQLGLYLLAASFQDVHRHLGFVAVLQRDRRSLDRLDLIRGQEPHSIHQHQISHSLHGTPEGAAES